MLIVAIHFWNISTNSLHLKCGMLTPTLLGVAAITGLKPIGETFDPDDESSEISFNFNKTAYGLFIAEHNDTESAEVNAEEHVAFLTYWLSMYILCTRSIQLAKGYIMKGRKTQEGGRGG